VDWRMRQRNFATIPCVLEIAQIQTAFRLSDQRVDAVRKKFHCTLKARYCRPDLPQ